MSRTLVRCYWTTVSALADPPQRHPLCAACPCPVEILCTVADQSAAVNPFSLWYEPAQPVGVLRVPERPQCLHMLFPGLCLCNPL